MPASCSQYAGIPHPARGGPRAVVAIPEESRIRERKPPRRLPLQPLPITPDRGRYRFWGWGRRGGGKKPPPLSLHSICRHPPPLPASGLLPRPEGRGQSWRYPRKAVSGRVNPRASSFFRLFPIRWTVGGIPAPRGDTRGGPYPGEETPAPARSSGSPHTLDRGRYPRPEGDTRGGPYPGE
jgi:hypothetical protein